MAGVGCRVQGHRERDKDGDAGERWGPSCRKKQLDKGARDPETPHPHPAPWLGFISAKRTAGPDPARAPPAPSHRSPACAGHAGVTPPKAGVHPLQGVCTPPPQGGMHPGLPAGCRRVPGPTGLCCTGVFAPNGDRDPSNPPTVALRDSEWSPSPLPPPPSPAVPPLTLPSLPPCPAALFLAPRPARTGAGCCPR